MEIVVLPFLVAEEVRVVCTFTGVGISVLAMFHVYAIGRSILRKKKE